MVESYVFCKNFYVYLHMYYICLFVLFFLCFSINGTTLSEEQEQHFEELRVKRAELMAAGKLKWVMLDSCVRDCDAAERINACYADALANGGILEEDKEDVKAAKVFSHMYSHTNTNNDNNNGVASNNTVNNNTNHNVAVAPNNTNNNTPNNTANNNNSNTINAALSSMSLAGHFNPFLQAFTNVVPPVLSQPDRLQLIHQLCLCACVCMFGGCVCVRVCACMVVVFVCVRVLAL